MVKDPLVTLDWNGGIDTNEHSGLIKLNVMKNATLEPPGVRYAPGGTTNLLSQRLLEQTGRKPSFSVASDDRLRRMYFDKVELRLEFKKRNDGFYWLTASPVMTLASMTPKAFETLEDNIVVMKWQYKLAHSNCNVCEIPSVVNGPPAISYPLLTNQLQALMALLEDSGQTYATWESGAKYVQLIQDEASRYKWVFLLQKKSDAADNVITLVRQKDFKKTV
ncbi:hypothetical protein PC116_g28631 [Phytophthora cactorum]|nr:hypothetical protein PC116_g28631 [Phytophthora cactorum]